MQKLKALKNKVGKYEGLVTTYEDILTLIEMGIEEQDDSVYEEVKEMNDSFLAEYEALRIATMLDGEYDLNNAILTLRGQAAQRRVTGQICFSACIPDGRRRKASRWRYWICWTAMKPD